ncbi:MAG: RNA 2',3'-cyclic phosphodiesterase [Thermoplasmata archaeon]
MRTFIAIKFDPNQKILDLMNDIKSRYKIKTVEPENLHATIKFLGEIDEKSADKILKDLEKINFKKFKVTLVGLGAFPNEKRARVLWIGIKSDEFMELGKKINDLLKGIGEDNFSPHLTLGRLKETADVSEFVKNFKDTVFKECEITYFSFYRSTLTEKGPIYTEIKRFNLLD